MTTEWNHFRWGLLLRQSPFPHVLWATPNSATLVNQWASAFMAIFNMLYCNPVIFCLPSFLLIPVYASFCFYSWAIHLYISETVAYVDADKFCQNQGYLHLAVMDTDERQHIFSIAMAIEQEGWVQKMDMHSDFRQCTINILLLKCHELIRLLLRPHPEMWTRVWQDALVGVGCGK